MKGSTPFASLRINWLTGFAPLHPSYGFAAGSPALGKFRLFYRADFAQSE